MKILVVAVLAVMLLVPTLARADNFFEDINDIIKCRNEDFPMRLYSAITLTKIPLIPADLRIKVSTPTGEGFFEEGLAEVGLEFKF